MTIYIDFKTVVEINEMVITHLSPKEQIGVKSYESLDAAIHRPMQTWGGQDLYDGLHAKAAALLQGLAQNHPFHNGNKRTAFLATPMFYRFNDCALKFLTTEEAVEFVVDIVKNELQFEEIIQILKTNTRCQ